MQVGHEYLVGTTPFALHEIGAIRSPKLKTFMCDERGVMNYDIYKIYLSTILMEPKSFHIIFNGQTAEWWDEQSDDFKKSQDMTALALSNPNSIRAYEEAFDFFFIDKVKYSEEHELFITFNGETDESDNLIVTGRIPKENFKEVCGVIAQLNGIITDETTGASKPKFKNKKAEELMAKIQKGQEERSKAKKEDKNLALPNLISAIASNHNSLNYTNIYELTVTQLYDVFKRMQNAIAFNMNCTGVSVWGDSEGKFKYDGWFKYMND